MRPSIAVVDYGAGNLRSVTKALEAAGGAPRMASTPADLARADGIVIPGVGHFSATAAADAAMRDGIRTAFGSKPVLGVCLGLHFLFDGSEEAPGVPGLGAIAGTCFRLPPTAKVPHAGWNTVDNTRASWILREIPTGTSFYFTHSFAAPVVPACVGRTSYTADFASVVEQDLVVGVQFHPEKSGEAGLRLLRNFVARC